jgi:exosome complex component RRP46
MAKIFSAPLNRADGSVVYEEHGYSVIAAVNGPLEVLRRDELSQEATIEVILRPAIGAGGERSHNRHF